MRNVLIKAGVSLLLGSQVSVASAIEFQDTIQVGYHDYEAEYLNFESAGLDTYGYQGFSAIYRHYLETIDVQNLPILESAFYQQKSSIFAGGGIYDTTGTYSDDDSYQVMGVSGEYYIPKARLYFAGDYTYYEDDGDNRTTVAVGVVPIKGLRIATEWDTEEDYNENVSVKYVQPFASGQAINIEYDYETASPEGYSKDQYEALLDFYFSPTFGVGVFTDTDRDTGVILRAAVDRVVLSFAYQESRRVKSYPKHQSEYFAVAVEWFF